MGNSKYLSRVRAPSCMRTTGSQAIPAEGNKFWKGRVVRVYACRWNLHYLCYRVCQRFREREQTTDHNRQRYTLRHQGTRFRRVFSTTRSFFDASPRGREEEERREEQSKEG